MDTPERIKLDSSPVSAETISKEAPVNVPVLEEKLVNAKEVNGYYVETYQEFEVTKDQEGNVIESVPTDNYQYISYQLK